MKSQRRRSAFARGIVTLAGSALLVWTALITALWWGQETLLFEPKVLASNLSIDAPDVTEDWVDVPGARLHAIQFRQPMVNGVRHTKGLIFYLHGNAGNVATWFVDSSFWRDSGYDLYMMDYRGFGKSTGRIESEAQLHADVQTAWERIAPAYAGLKTVIFGRSLGTGLAVQLAATVQPDLLILVSPYSSMTAVMNVHYPWAPDAILRYPLASDRYIQQIRHATLIFHGLRDTVIPVAQAEALQERAHRAELILLPNVGHGDVQEDATYRNTLLERLRDL
jgi:pimeloyl-ACP methyl ester carboxylesterase